MTTPSAPNPRVDALGVVDPMHVPGLDRITRRWRALPFLARLFVVLAVVDVLARALRLAGIAPTFDIDLPITMLPTISHVAVVVLPAALLLRRPDAATTTPLLLRGAVALALVELLGDWVLRIVPPFDLTGAWAGAQVVIAICRTAAYILLGYGLTRLRPPEPRPALAGLANLVAAAIAGSAIVGVATQLVMTEQLDADLYPEGRLVNAFVAASLVAFAYLGRAVVRACDDSRRPIRARYLATLGFVLAAIDAAVLVALGGYLIYRQVFASSLPQPEGLFGLGWFGTGLGMVLFVVAFGLGLGDTSGRMRRLDGEPWDAPEPDRENLSWPAPGSEVPAFRDASKESPV